MMTKTLRDLLAQAESWPREDQDELAEYAREIEARRTGVYVLSEDERAAVHQGLAEADRKEFLAELGLEEPGLNRVIRGAYTLLGLLTYFTAGPKEVRAWTVRNGSTAPWGVSSTTTPSALSRSRISSDAA